MTRAVGVEVTRTGHSIVAASVLAVALAAGAVLAASARASFPGRNGLIAYDARVGYDSQIFVMNADGSGQRQVTHSSGQCYGPSISPDGRTIVFVTNGEIRALTSTGAGGRHLATGGEFPSYSPDGKRVVFGCRNQVWVMRADGTHQRRLTSGSSLGIVLPSFSPDGKSIVFVSVTFGAKDRAAIWTMNADGSHLRRLAYASRSIFGGSYGFGVSFSPDGKRIVYGADGAHSVEIHLMNADGTNQRRLARSWNFTRPCFSPDGRQIVCYSNVNHQTWVTTTSGLHWRCLTHIRGGAGEPNWGPHPR